MQGHYKCIDIHVLMGDKWISSVELDTMIPPKNMTTNFCKHGLKQTIVGNILTSPYTYQTHHRVGKGNKHILCSSLQKGTRPQR